MRSLSSLLAPLLLLPSTLASTLNLHISPSNALLDLTSLPPTTHATLYGGPSNKRLTAPLRRTNNFIFENLEAGNWLLDVHSRDHVFPSLRVDVQDSLQAPSGVAEAVATDGAEAQVKEVITVYLTHPANAWDHRGAKIASSYSLDRDIEVSISALGKREFYEQRTGFDLLGFFKNPMILMGLVSMGLVFGMPYLMENMDPEMKAEFEEIQKSGPMGSQGAASQIQNFDLAGWMAGKSDSGNAPAAATTAAPATGGNGGSKRR